MTSGRFLFLLGIVVASSCTGGPLPTPDPYLSETFVQRIREAGDGKAWYSAIELADGQPDAYVMGSGGVGPTGTAVAGTGYVTLAAGIGGTSATAREVCSATLAAANDATLGPPLDLPHVWVGGADALRSESFVTVA